MQPNGLTDHCRTRRCTSVTPLGRQENRKVSRSGLSCYRVTRRRILTFNTVDTQEHHCELPHDPTNTPYFPDRKGRGPRVSAVLPRLWWVSRFLTLARGNRGVTIPGAVTLLPFTLMVGSPVVIMPQFDPEGFCRNIEKYKVTISFIVPPVCLAVVHHPGTSCT